MRCGLTGKVGKWRKRNRHTMCKPIYCANKRGVKERITYGFRDIAI